MCIRDSPVDREREHSDSGTQIDDTLGVANIDCEILRKVVGREERSSLRIHVLSSLVEILKDEQPFFVVERSIRVHKFHRLSLIHI